jgi:aspartate aminotransferase
MAEVLVSGDRPDLPRLRPVVDGMEMQKIIAVSAYARGFEDVIALWYGESDIVTDDRFREACKDALDQGHTFYADKNGEPPLRAALSDYLSGLHAQPVTVERITVTASGMAALHMLTEMLVDPGDNIVMVTPMWPNAEAVVRLMNGDPRRVPLTADDQGAWHLDLGQLADACDGRTRAILVNSPANPTGWTIGPDQQRALLDLARDRGIWIIADEVYGRIVYDGEAAPSFLDVAGPDDPLFVINSFSKSWAMTGWRLGWVVAPAVLESTLANMVEYATSGATAFSQHAAVAAIRDGEAFVRRFRDYCRVGRDIVTGRLAALPRVTCRPPDGAFYAFLRVDGETDSEELARRIVREAHVGLAPGIAFGPEAEGWLRICFAQSPDLLTRAMDRLEPVLA